MIRPATLADLDAIAGLRSALWPGESAEALRAEAEASLASGDARLATLVAVEGGKAVGFAEVSLRTDYVNGCETCPVAFLEGIYVRPEWRRRAIGRALVEAAAQWGRDRGCRELASDALLDNTASLRFHGAAGFEETERVVCFRKRL